MYGFLIAADYNKQIQAANLQQVISNDQTILDSAQQAGEAEAKSYLRQKFDIATELAPTVPWDPTATYNAHDTIYLDADPFDPTAEYEVDALVLYTDGKVYICTIAVTIPAAFDPTDWTVLGALNQIFYGSYPKPLFNYLAVYKVGAIVFWNNNTYIALQATTVLTQGAQFQNAYISNTPVVNVFPDDPVKGASYWGSPTVYVIEPGTLPTDDDFWTIGDNRDQQMVMYFIDLTLYHVHTRIAPQNIPKQRERRYDAAVRWLEKCAEGDVTPELPVLQPRQGGRIRFGGQAKAQNFR